MSIWTALDIDPTRDTGEIRRAYARRLKVASPEDDAEAFQRLRAAYEQALALARLPALVATDVPETGDGDEDEARDVDEDEPFVWPFQGGGSSSGDWIPGPSHAGFGEVERLLQGSAMPDPRTLLALWRAALADIEALDMADAMTIEAWTAQLILEHEPRSDVLILSTIETFGWDQWVETGRGAHLISAVIARTHEPAFYLDLEEAGKDAHPFAHVYWLLQRRPLWLARAYSRISPELHRDVPYLLDLLAATRPDLLDRLSAEHVGWWRRHLSGFHIGPLMLVSGIVAAGLAIPNIVAPDSFVAEVCRIVALYYFVMTILAATPAFLQRRLLRGARRRLLSLVTQHGRALTLAGMAGLIATSLAAGLLPASLPVTLGLGALALVLMTGTALVGRPDRRSKLYDRPVEGMARPDPWIMWLGLALLDLPLAHVIQFGVPTGCAIIALRSASSTLIEALVRRPPLPVTISAAAALALAGVVLTGVVLANLGPNAMVGVAWGAVFFLLYRSFATEAGRGEVIARWVLWGLGACLLLPGFGGLAKGLYLLLTPLAATFTLIWGAAIAFGRAPASRKEIP